MKFVKDMFLGKYKKNWRENESKYDISLDVYMKFSIIKKVLEKAKPCYLYLVLASLILFIPKIKFSSLRTRGRLCGRKQLLLLQRTRV